MERPHPLAPNTLSGAVSGPAFPLSQKPRSMAEEPQRPRSPDIMGRSSFSSVRENDSDLAQTFTSSKFSSYRAVFEHAIDDSPGPPPASGKMAVAAAAPPLTRPHSKLHFAWYPADSFKGWKEINVKGKLASKSFGDLQVLNMALLSDCAPSDVYEGDTMTSMKKPSVFERLPLEVFGLIIEHLVLDVPPHGIERRNVDLMSLLLTSQEIHAKTVETVYRRVTIPHSRIFRKFLNQIKEHPSHGTWVRRLDFSHFNPDNLFSSAKERAATKNLTTDTLLQCLDLTPNLQEFLAQEYIDDDLSAEIIQKLFLGLEKLQAVDFCGCSSASFKQAFSSVSRWNWPQTSEIQRLSFHKCRTLPVSVFENILPRLAHLTHLDVAGTKITDAALHSIPKTAKISHLNISNCKGLTAEGVIKFFSEHPAVQRRLTFLSLSTDASTHDSLEIAYVDRLVKVLPKTLRSLGLKGSKMDATIIQALLPLTKYLEELALGHGFEASDIDKLLGPDPSADPEEQMAWTPSTLKYLDMSDMLAGDMVSLFNGSLLLTKQSLPLDVVEVSDAVVKRLKKSMGTLTQMGWRVSEVHSRSWLVRDADPEEPRDDGRRSWKMGAQFWGMRKIPVATAEVGGMYGSFMFGRNL